MRRIQAVPILMLIVMVLTGGCFAAVGIQAKTGNILIDGKPFFPIGIYCAEDKLPADIDLGNVKALGFNSVVFSKKPTPATISKTEKAGLVVLEAPKALAMVAVDDVSKFEYLMVSQRPTPKLFIISVPDEMLENAVARAVIDGGKGVLFSAEHLSDNETMKKISSELELMSKVALAPFPVEHLLVVEDRMQAMYKEIDGRRYILAANITYKPQSLFLYPPDAVSKPTVTIGREELILAETGDFQCGFEKYGILMFSWLKEGK